MASKIYGAITLTGGSDGAVDTIVYSVLNDGDMCIAIVGGATDTVYFYTFDANSSAAESSPDVIKPDAAGGGNGRWILTHMRVNDLTTSDDVVVGDDLSVAGDAAVTGAITGASLQLGGAGATCTGILDEDAMGSNSATDLATQQSIKKYVDDQVAGVTVSYDFLAGWLVRPKFGWSSSTAITIKGGRYHTKAGAQTEGIHKWDSTLTFTFESGGSNAASTDFSGNGSTWFYLYLDESSFTDNGATLLTAANFVANTTAPTWDADELAWYNGNDRCIAAFYINSSEELDEFYMVNDLILWSSDVNIKTGFTTSWVDVTARAPALGDVTSVHITFESQVAVGGTYYWRPNGSSGTGHQCGFGANYGGSDNKFTQSLWAGPVYLDSTQVFEIKSTSAAASGIVWQNGYYLPEGM